MNILLINFLARSPSYANSEPINVKALSANIKILLFHLISNLHMHIFKFLRHPRHCLFLATSKARVRYDMSNKQSLSFEKCILFFR